MSEFERNLEVEPTVELVANGLEHWLAKEVGSSMVGRNSCLDDSVSLEIASCCRMRIQLMQTLRKTAATTTVW